MNYKTSFQQFDVPVLSSLCVSNLKKNICLSLVAETLTHGELDFLWLHVFSRVQPGVAIIKRGRRKANRRTFIQLPTTFRKTENIFSVLRKVKWMIAYLKDLQDISSLPITRGGNTYTTFKRCEQTKETSNVVFNLGFFLEDIKIFSNFFYRNRPELLAFIKKVHKT